MHDFPIARFLLTVFVLFVGATLFLGILGMATGIVSLPFRVFNQANRVIDKTIDADNVIYNYEYFKQACQDIKAQEQKIANARDEMTTFLATADGDHSKWDWNDKQEFARLSANVTGARNVQLDLVAQYNARAKMMNRKLFNTEPCDAQVTR